MISSINEDLAYGALKDSWKPNSPTCTLRKRPSAVLAISPGDVVRIRFSREEWYVPVDNAEGVARLITRRAERYRSTLEDDEADTA